MSIKRASQYVFAVLAVAAVIACRQASEAGGQTSQESAERSQLAKAADEKKAAPKKEEAKKGEAKKGEAAKPGQKTAAELEKEKAMSEPYSNDYGPKEIDAIVAGYPKDYQKGYGLMKQRCSQCHEPSRPLNSRFVETPGKDDAERAANLAKLKKEKPELFAPEALAVWQIEDGVWKRYVKRMAAKPGCEIKPDEAKEIWKFLVYDSNQRKMGANAKKWEEHRRMLLDKLKKEHPKRFKDLEEQKDL